MRAGTVLASMLVIVGVAAGGPPSVSPRAVRGVGFVTYDYATGEVVPGQYAPRDRLVIWKTIGDMTYYFPHMEESSPSGDSGWLVLDWGDVADETDVYAYEMGYGTDVVGTELDCLTVFYANDNGFNSSSRVSLVGYLVTGLPTADPNHIPMGWIVTVELDFSGIILTITGDDIDGNDLADFSYTYWFPGAEGTATGAMIVDCDPNLPEQATGVEDAFDAFYPDSEDPNTFRYLTTYWFGGDPFAQFYMALLGYWVYNCPYPGESWQYCDADIDGSEDCIVDLADLAVLLGNYGTTSGATHDMGDLEPEDGDGDVDLADLAALLAQYGDDCNQFPDSP